MWAWPVHRAAAAAGISRTARQRRTTGSKRKEQAETLAPNPAPYLGGWHPAVLAPLPVPISWAGIQVPANGPGAIPWQHLCVFSGAIPAGPDLWGARFRPLGRGSSCGASPGWRGAVSGARSGCRSQPSAAAGPGRSPGSAGEWQSSSTRCCRPCASAWPCTGCGDDSIAALFRFLPPSLPQDSFPFCLWG